MIKNDNDRLVPFAELANEIAIEEGRDFVDYKNVKDDVYKMRLEDQSKNYVKDLKKKFIDIIESKGKDPSAYKNSRGHFVIPIDEKPMIKTWIKQYSSKGVKKIRDKKDYEITYEDKVDLIERMHKDINNENNLHDKDNKISQINEINMYAGSKAAVEVIPELKEMVQETISEVILSDNKIMRNLLDKDYEALIFLYKEMMTLVKNIMDTVVSECKEYRNSEIVDNSIEFVRMMDSESKEHMIDEVTSNHENPLNMVEEIITDMIEEKQVVANILEIMKDYRIKYESNF